MGRQSKYKAEYAEQARKLCVLGATNEELADFFEVGGTTIDRWLVAHPEFKQAVKDGKTLADAQVAEKLFKRATGYSHPEDDIRAINGEIVITPTTKRYPPDTVAAIFWLKNRQPTKWRDKPVADEGDSVPTPVQIVIRREDASDNGDAEQSSG
ncbi:hypothetical protein [Carnimonas bestiolae]|uniref:hypothetical protein n=1 Tax=Carnimonas bestiolae TaxID=3402172 RepID=UPI003EDC09A7